MFIPSFVPFNLNNNFQRLLQKNGIPVQGDASQITMKFQYHIREEFRDFTGKLMIKSNAMSSQTVFGVGSGTGVPRKLVVRT